MDSGKNTSNPARSRNWAVLVFGVLGLAIAGCIASYCVLTDSSASHRLNFALWTAFVIICPPALLSIPLIDIETGSSAFAMMWLVIGLLNGCLYSGIAMLFSRLLRKRKSQAEEAA